MNNVIETILNRRSVRKYLPDAIKQEEVDAIVQSGLWAPSASNKQDWHATVIQSKALIDELNEDYRRWMSSQKDNKRYNVTMQDGYHVFFSAPLLIHVAYEGSNVNWGATNAALMAENMCIAAESLGIGSCQIGLPLPMLRDAAYADTLAKLQLPEGYVPNLFISFGYPDKTVTPVRRPRREGCVTNL